jgi:MFS family permease
MGHTRKVVWIGTFLVVIAQLGVSFCDQYYQLIIVQGVIFGLGSGMLMSAASTTVPHWFETLVDRYVDALLTYLDAGMSPWVSSLLDQR